jgi:hypothetical protein
MAFICSKLRESCGLTLLRTASSQRVRRPRLWLARMPQQFPCPPNISCFEDRNRPPDSPLTLNGRNIPFVNSVKYLGVSFDKRVIYICYVVESRPPLWSSGQSSWLHNGSVLCFLWGTNWIYICYVKESRPPLWSEFLGTERRCIVLPVRYELNLYMLCRRK